MKIESLLAEVLQVSVTQVTSDFAMKDSEAWDSLKHMELILSLEKSFDVGFTFDEIVAMQSVREIRYVLKERKAI